MLICYYVNLSAKCFSYKSVSVHTAMQTEEMVGTTDVFEIERVYAIDRFARTRATLS